MNNHSFFFVHKYDITQLVSMIKSYSQFINEDINDIIRRYQDRGGVKKEDELTDDKVRSFLKYDCYPHKIAITFKNGEQVVDVEGNFYFEKNIIEGGHLPFKFGNVTGNFTCDDNGLTTLEGCPETVGGYFTCTDNNLTSLEGCPEEVGESIYCCRNELTSLEGCPNAIGIAFDCSDNKLTSLKGCPKEVGGDFYCDGNQLTSLEGCSQTVGGNFYCKDNAIEFQESDIRNVCNLNGYILKKRFK